MKLRSEHSPAEEARIEIIPLIDVIFCILTFFILAALGLTRQSTIGLDLPRAATGTTEMRDMLIVSIDPIGQTYIERNPVTRDQLLDAMFDYQATNPAGIVVLYASRSASYNDVVEVLDLLRSVGGDRVALATLPDASVDPALTTPGSEQFEFNFDGQPGSLELPGVPGSPAPNSAPPGAAPGNELGLPELDVPANPPGNSSN